MENYINTILNGNSLELLKTLPDQCVQTCITSPPYWGLRDYGNDDQLGLEKTPQQYVENMVLLFREVRRVLKDDGTLWLNLGDSYSGSGKGPAGNLGAKHNERHLEHKHGAIVPEGLKPKDLIGIPWRVAFALQQDGWYLRQDIIWHKPNPMPESVTDRCTKAHEYIFLMTKSAQYYYDHDAIKESAKPDVSIRDRDNTKLNNTPGRTRMNGLTTNHYDSRNKRSVWTVPTKPYKEAHFAVFPDELIKPCVLAGSKKNDVVFDPFLGSGTTGLVALRSRRRFIGIELNPEYVNIANDRLRPYLKQHELF